MSSINGVSIFRELNDSKDVPLEWLDARGQLFNVVDPKGVEHLFVDNDLPRDVEITQAIVANTRGFALFSDDGEYIGSYRSLDRATKAQEGAKLVVKADVEAESDEDVFDIEKLDEGIPLDPDEFPEG